MPIIIRFRLFIISNISGEIFDIEIFRFRLKLLFNPNFLGLFIFLNIINILGIYYLSPGIFNVLEEVLKEEIYIIRIKRTNIYILFLIFYIIMFFNQIFYYFTISF